VRRVAEVDPAWVLTVLFYVLAAAFVVVLL